MRVDRLIEKYLNDSMDNAVGIIKHYKKQITLLQMEKEKADTPEKKDTIEKKIQSLRDEKKRKIAEYEKRGQKMWAGSSPH